MALSQRVSEERLTFDDVLLLPSYSDVLPGDVSLKGAFAKGIALNTPIASAAMDTVTEAGMAIAMALQGGIGVIHKNMSLETQVAQVRLVKRKVNFIVTDPATIAPEATLAELNKLSEERDAHSFPVVKDGKLVGIITSRDTRFETDLNKKVSELMVPNPVSVMMESLKDFAPQMAVETLCKHRIDKLPVVTKTGKLLGLVTYRDFTITSNYPGATRDKQGRLVVAAAISPKDDSRAKALVEAGVDCLVVDTAHGNSKNVIDAVARFSKAFGVPIVAGNICTADAAENLIKAGAAGVKVGIGAGSICTTRVISGCGSPQLSAIIDCAKSCHDAGVPLIADGGIKYSGDAVKALAAGASCIMLGGMLAGTEESPGRIVIMGGRKYKTYRGMGSLGAMNAGTAGKDRYFQSSVTQSSKLVPEGVEAVVPFKGSVEEVLYQTAGGIRSGMGYCGTKDIAALWKAKMVRITFAGNIESHPHDVTITEEAPNYRVSRN